MASRIFESLRSFLGLQKKEARHASHPRILDAGNGIVFEVDEVRRGGMGVVYLCRLVSNDEEISGKEPHRVALKTFDERHFFDVAMTDVVRRESSVWTLLSGLPFIFPLGKLLTIDQKPHLMMPVAEPDEHGVATLAEAIRRSPEGLPEEHCLEVGMCVACALTAAAKRIDGVVHGDIKPDNLLYLNGLPFLSDFGLARMKQEGGSGGTAPYMAPELWTEEGAMSVASDVYALGVTLYETLTGALPLVSDGNDAEEWAELHTNGVASFPAADPDSMRGRLRAVIEGCLSKEPDHRPGDFSEVVGELLSIGMENGCLEVLRIVEIAGKMNELGEAMPLEIHASRISDLLREEEYDGAMRLLEQMPEEELRGDLLSLAGTTYSLNGDDETALRLFERFLDSDPAPSDEERRKCLSEMGLSLRRLGRLEEASELYEKLLTETGGAGSQAAVIRGNYSAVLLDLGKTGEALSHLQLLTRNHPETPEGWALLATVLEKEGRFEEALKAASHGVSRAPRNGQLHVLRARCLIRLQRIGEAIVAAEAAYGLGYHSRDWVVVTAAAHIMADDRATVAGLLESLKGQLPEETVMDMMKEAFNSVADCMGEESTGDGGEQERTIGKDGEEDVVTAASDGEVGQAEVVPVDDDPEQDNDGADPERQAREEREAHDAISRGESPHFQMRFSMVDNSFAVDFYFDVGSPDYVKTFSSGYRDMRWRIDHQFPGMNERERRYRFARCTHCDFKVLTARDESESFVCQACTSRGPVETIGGDVLRDLAAECEAAIGRSTEEDDSEDDVVFVAFWRKDLEIGKGIAERMEAEGFRRLEPKSNFELFITNEITGQRGVAGGLPDQVWAGPARDGKERLKGQTPLFLDRIIRDLRRQFGTIVSASSQFGGETASMMMQGEGDRRRLMEEVIGENPNDTETRRTLVTAYLQEGEVDRAKELASMMSLAFPDDPNTWFVRGAIAHAEDRHENAIADLELFVEALPRDLGGRALLVRALEDAGEEEKAANHLWHYTKLGGMLPDAGPPEGEEDGPQSLR